MTTLLDGLQRVQEALEAALCYLPGSRKLKYSPFGEAHTALALLPSLIEQAKGVDDEVLAQVLTNAFMQASGSEPKCVKQLGKDMVPWVRNYILPLPQPPKEG